MIGRTGYGQKSTSNRNSQDFMNFNGKKENHFKKDLAFKWGAY